MYTVCSVAELSKPNGADDIGCCRWSPPFSCVGLNSSGRGGLHVLPCVQYTGICRHCRGWAAAEGVSQRFLSRDSKLAAKWSSS